MFQIFPIGSNTNTVNEADNTTAVCPSKEEVLHESYMTKEVDQRFRDFYYEGVFDLGGKVREEWASYSLPPLNAEELFALQNYLLEEHRWHLDEEINIRISPQRLLVSLCNSEILRAHGLRVYEIDLMGSFFSSFLMMQPQYPRRVLELFDLKLSHHLNKFRPTGLQDCYVSLFLSQSYFPKMIYLLTAILAGAWQEEHPVQDSGPIFHKIFETLNQSPLIKNEHDCCLQISFPGVPFKLFLSTVRTSPSPVHSWNDLYLPLEPLFNPFSTGEISPNSHNGAPAVSFFHLAAGTFYVASTENMTEETFFDFIDMTLSGKISAQQDFVFKEAALEKLVSSWEKEGGADVIEPLKQQLSRRMATSYPNDPEGAFLFVFTTLCHLQPFLSKEESATLLTEFNHLQVTSPLASSLKKAIEQGLPLKIIESILQLAGFLGSPHFEVGTFDFVKPCLRCSIEDKTVSLDCRPDQALRRVLASHGKVSEKAMQELFFCFRPLSSANEAPSAALTNALTLEGFSDEEFRKDIYALIDLDAHFLSYLAVSSVLIHPTFSSTEKIHVTENNVYPLITWADDPDALVKQIETSLGQKGLLPVCQDDFLEKWIVDLFKRGGRSAEIGCRLWKREFLAENENITVAFSLKLMESLLPEQMEYAAQIFHGLKQKNILVSSEPQVRECLACCLELCAKVRGYHPLVEQINEVLSHSSETVSLAAGSEKESEELPQDLAPAAPNLREMDFDTLLDYLLENKVTDKTSLHEVFNTLQNKVRTQPLDEKRKAKLEKIMVSCSFGSKMGKQWLATLSQLLTKKEDLSKFTYKCYLQGKDNYKLPLKSVCSFLSRVALRTSDEKFRFILLNQLLKFYPEHIDENKLYPILKLPCSSSEIRQQKYASLTNMCAIEYSVADEFIAEETAYLANLIEEGKFTECAALFSKAGFFEKAMNLEPIEKFVLQHYLPLMHTTSLDSLLTVSPTSLKIVTRVCDKQNEPIPELLSFCHSVMSSEDAEVKELSVALFLKMKRQLLQLSTPNEWDALISLLGHCADMGKKEEVYSIFTDLPLPQEPRQIGEILMTILLHFWTKEPTQTIVPYIVRLAPQLASADYSVNALAMLPVLIPRLLEENLDLFRACATPFMDFFFSEKILSRKDRGHWIVCPLNMLNILVSVLPDNPQQTHLANFVKKYIAKINSEFASDLISRKTAELIRAMKANIPKKKKN